MVERKTKEREVRHVPLSREFLEQRGFCCDSGCANCPYKEKDMKQEKEKYEDIQAKAEGGLAAALAAASKARHQKPSPPDEPDVPEPVKVESPAPDEVEPVSEEEIGALLGNVELASPKDEYSLRDELGVIREDIVEIKEMMVSNTFKMKQILSKLSALNSKTASRR